MQSKRQDDPPKKTLARPPQGWQEVLQQNASRILLGLTLAVLAVVIFRYRSQTATQRQATARASAVRARGDLQQLEEAMLLSNAPPDQLAGRRDQLAAQVKADLAEALDDSDESDSVLRADAYAIRGDLYWTLANSPVFPGSATRPTLEMTESPATLLTQAEADYRHVLAHYSNQLLDWATAEFGLAAIAENRSDWDEAKKRYDEVVNRSDALEMWKATARDREALLAQIRQPLLIGPYPATTQYSTQATTTATTLPAPLTPFIR